MTTRWKQKISIALAISAIVSLLLMLILLWSAVSNGMLSSNKRNKININENQENNVPAISSSSSINIDGNVNGEGQLSDLNRNGITADSINVSTTTASSTITTDTVTSEDYVHEEFIKPMKVHQLPLHPDDLLYESKRNNTIKDNFQTNKITGNFRNKSSRIWDPHPEYIINAFGHNMHLMLYQDTSFIHSSFKVIDDYGNDTAVQEGGSLGCHYKGHVLNDQSSIVAVSLCHGMTGHIKTSYGSFFIEPVDPRNTNDPNREILHRIWRQPKQDNHFRQHVKGHNCHIHDHEQSQDYNGVDLINHGHEENMRKRKKRSTYEKNEYTLEVVVAVDRKMLNFHGHDLIDSYVLTLMSIVSNIFSDASIGNSINIAVVKIRKIRKKLNVTYFDEGVYASELLKEFCKDMQDSGIRYDTAILLTREQICRNVTETRCDTLGLAELGTVCKGDSCSIVQDNGLSAAFTIAHELGHILNMPHDDDKKCTQFKKDGKQMLNIMASTMGNDIHPWSWSDCSRYYVTEFLESEKIYCMDNSPHNPISIQAKKLPGEIYSLNQQCELIYGPYATHCVIDEKECGLLWCQERPESQDCKSSGLPWADGTPCKDNKHWCQKGDCVHRDLIGLAPVHGGWGPWSEFTPCSRTCGGGVQESERLCNAPIPRNGGRYCSGNRKQYQSCNTHNCLEDVPDFREQQCAEFNGDNFNYAGIDPNVRWVPKYGVSSKDECKLFCRPERSSEYFQLADKVKDGTTCSYDSYNKCVNGVCRRAGCDNILDSPAKLNRCGNCEESDDTCHEISGQFQQSDLIGKEYANNATFYYDVIRIPKGASNIEINQIGYPDSNYLVIVKDNGEYLFNSGNVIESYKKEFAYGGVFIEYSGSTSALERINTTYLKKIKRDLIVQILSMPQDNQTNEILLTYSYTVDKIPYIDPNRRRHIQPPSKRDIYKWELDSWNLCDSLCQGQRSRTAVCVNKETGQKVASTFCDIRLKPIGPFYQACNLECELTVNITSVSECSATCGQLGKRQKNYVCIQKFSTSTVIVDMSYCFANFKNLSKFEDCSEACWNYSEWSECSKTCNTGHQRRKAFCRFNNDVVDEFRCSKLKKSELIRTCHKDPCPSAWSEEGRTPYIIKRPLPSTPMWNVTNYYHPSRSYSSNKIDESYNRKVEIFTGNAWATDLWSDCNDSCERTRSVYCKDNSNPANCPIHLKPKTIEKCCDIKYVQQWSPCSVKCGDGIKKKQIICAKILKSDRAGGKSIKMPIRTEICQMRNLIKPTPKLLERPCRNICNWVTGPWSPCLTTSNRTRTNNFSSRSVNCTTKKKQFLPDEYCYQTKKPDTTKKCVVSAKILYEESNCTCGGFKRRKYICYDSNNKHIPCDAKHKSARLKCRAPQECVLKSCEHIKRRKNTTTDGEYLISIKRNLVRIYCHNMATRPTEYLTLNPEENYSLYYPNRAKDPKNCPRNNNRDTYEFPDDSIQAGFTRFDRIRINIRTMKVIEDDFTFATSSGTPQKFASAGDCYNTKEECPQGFFSINLNGTNFRIARNTKWDTYGDFTSMKFLRELRYPFKKVQAFCGGYCGRCFPSKNTSLVLDVV